MHEQDNDKQEFMQPWIPPNWTALVIFYVISLHTVANHSDDHTAVNIINCKRKKIYSWIYLWPQSAFTSLPVMKPILPSEEIAQTTSHEIPRPSRSCLQFR